MPLSPSDHFAQVRSLGGTLIVMLGLRASMRAATYLVHRVTSPPAGVVDEQQFTSMRMIDGGLLGIENLVTIVAMITFLVWIHRVFVAIRASGRTTRWSPGWAVGGWFVPVANAVLPWLTVRDALRSLGKPTALAGAWWIAWLVVIPLTMLQSFVRQLVLVPELDAALRGLPSGTMQTLFELSASTFWPHFILDTGVWVLLLLIVSTVRNAAARM